MFVWRIQIFFKHKFNLYKNANLSLPRPDGTELPGKGQNSGELSVAN